MTGEGADMHIDSRIAQWGFNEAPAWMTGEGLSAAQTKFGQDVLLQ